MEGEAKAQRKRKQQVLTLVSKIKRLKNKLLSYGLTGKESNDAILYEFLKAPQIDWTIPHNTVTFYQIQTKYHVDHSTAELILLLHEIVPNWQAKNVVQYLHQTLTYNALSFGIHLEYSDDSSNQDSNDMTSLLVKAKKKNSQFGLKPKKRTHQSGPSTNVHIFNSVKDFQNYDQEQTKKIHFNQSFEELKPERKETEQNCDEESFNDRIPKQVPSMIGSMTQSERQQSGQLKEQLQEKGQKPIRKHPVDYQYLEQQRIEKKLKK